MTNINTQKNKKKSGFFRLGRCPYCKSKVPYTKAFFERDNGEYICPDCDEVSNIYFIKRMNIVISIVSAIAVTVFILYLFFGNKASLLGATLVMIPFVLFFLMTPFFFRLHPFDDDSSGSSKSKNISSKTAKFKSVENDLYSKSRNNIKSGTNPQQHRTSGGAYGDRSVRTSEQRRSTSSSDRASSRSQGGRSSKNGYSSYGRRF
ncbi:MAG: hypothetical protein ACI4II_07470 [Acutalibacteraceae bacterium]